MSLSEGVGILPGKRDAECERDGMGGSFSTADLEYGSIETLGKE